MYGRIASDALMSLTGNDDDMILSLKDTEISRHILRTICPIL